VTRTVGEHRGGVVRFKFEVLRASRVVEDAEQAQFDTTS
jgi:hypothetical protein